MQILKFNIMYKAEVCYCFKAAFGIIYMCTYEHTYVCMFYLTT